MAIRLSDVLDVLARGVTQTLERQVLDEGPDQGGTVRADWGIAEPTGTCGLVALCGMLYIARQLRPDVTPNVPEDADLLTRMSLATEYLMRVQRESGLIDLRDCNYDSSPDAAFAVLALCPVIELGRALRGRDAEWDGALKRIEVFTGMAAEGLPKGGFHTPNHRWVISAAMAWAGRLFPFMDFTRAIEAYLAEGIDADDDGAYIERSAGVYDAICDRSMMILWELLGHEPALRAAQANLALNLHMLHPDGTIETGASRRQDQGRRPVPGGLALPYLMAHRAEPDERFAQAASFLWSSGRGDTAGLAYHILRHGEPEAPHAEPRFPFDFRRAFPAIGLWRSRRGPISATAFAGTTRLFALVFGQAELSAVKISQSYFGVGRFVGDVLADNEAGCMLRSDGDQDVHRPGYDMPLGRPVDPARWFETRRERDWRALPYCVSRLTIREADDGFDLAYRTLHGATGVTAQMALDFPVGGVWETGDTCLRPEAGQVLFLKHGSGAMRYGHDVIEVGPGADAHRMWAMRDAETAPDHVRVLLTFETPVDHTVCIRCRRRP